MHVNSQVFVNVKGAPKLHTCIRGLPAQMWGFADTRCNAAVIMNDGNIKCHVVFAKEWGVCVCLKAIFGECLFEINGAS